MSTVRCFNKNTIQKANRMAVKRNYNRQLQNKFLKSLPEDKWFPVIFSMIHEYAKGYRVDPHIRCWVVFDEKGTRAFIDCDMDLYNMLQVFEVPDQEEAK